MKLEQLGGIVVFIVLLLAGGAAAQVRSAGARGAIRNTIEESNNEQQQQQQQQQHLRAAAAASSNTNSQPSTTPVDSSGAAPLPAITRTTTTTTTRTTEETRRLQPLTLTPSLDSCLERQTSKECVIVGDSLSCPVGSTITMVNEFTGMEKRHIVADLACPLDAIAQSSFDEAAAMKDGPCECSVKLARENQCELIDYYDDWDCKCRKCPQGSLLDYAYECTNRLTQSSRALSCNAFTITRTRRPTWPPVTEVPAESPSPQRAEAPETEVPTTAPTTEAAPETGSPTTAPTEATGSPMTEATGSPTTSAPSTLEPNPEQVEPSPEQKQPAPCPSTLGIGNLRCIGSAVERGRTVSRGSSILV